MANNRSQGDGFSVAAPPTLQSRACCGKTNKTVKQIRQSLEEKKQIRQSLEEKKQIRQSLEEKNLRIVTLISTDKIF